MTTKIPAKTFRDLIIWQYGMKVSKEVYNLTKKFPKKEDYTLTSQMRRCAISIPSNIAEGFLRKHNTEYKQFLRIALGSSGELETQLEIAFNAEYITEEQKNALLQNLVSIRRMTLNLIKCLK